MLIQLIATRNSNVYIRCSPVILGVIWTTHVHLIYIYQDVHRVDKTPLFHKMKKSTKHSLVWNNLSLFFQILWYPPPITSLIWPSLPFCVFVLYFLLEVFFFFYFSIHYTEKREMKLTGEWLKVCSVLVIFSEGLFI